MMFDSAQPIAEISGCTSTVLSEEVLTSSEPLVLRGLVKHWPMVGHALTSNGDAVEYLKSFYNQVPVPVCLGAPEIEGRIFYNDTFNGFNYAAKNVLFDGFLDEILNVQSLESPPTLYASSSVINQYLPDFERENYLDLAKRTPRASIWVGNRVRIPAHYDLPSNIACSVAGRRRFTLFPPEQVKHLYPGPLTWAPGGQAVSLVDFYQPDLDRFPLFKHALPTAQVAVLEPGDALYIPSMWWHHVEGLDALNILVNYWWRDEPAHMGPPLNVLHHALLGLRDLPVEQRKAWQALFNYYVFESTDETIQHIPEHARGFLGELTDETARKLRAYLLSQLNR